MSLLTALQAKRNNLKHTTTIITHPDGRKFETSNDEQQVTEITSGCGFIIDSKPDKIPAKIVEGVFLGSQDCCDFGVLHENGITSVLSIGIEAPTKFVGIEYKFVRCLDLPETNLVEEILKVCVDFILNVTKRHKRVLVHCNAGVSRSASVVIGYLILVHHFSYIDAYHFVKKARSCVRPNDGFVNQLKGLVST